MYVLDAEDKKEGDSFKVFLNKHKQANLDKKNEKPSTSTT